MEDMESEQAIFLWPGKVSNEGIEVHFVELLTEEVSLKFLTTKTDARFEIYLLKLTTGPHCAKQVLLSSLKIERFSWYKQGAFTPKS